MSIYAEAKQIKRRADSVLEEVFRSLFEEIDMDKLRAEVDALREAAPDFKAAQHARTLARRTAIRCAAAGAVTGLPLGLAAIGTFPWSNVPGYVVAQIAGGFLGGIVVWLTYLPHWEATADPAAKLAVFCTAPAIRKPMANVITEIIGTFVLVLAILAVLSPANLTQGSDWARGLGPLLVGAIVWSIGLSLGGPTGYAINPARDLGPRIAHAVLPLPAKGGSDWGYAWVPIVGPIIGGVLGALCYQLIWK